MKALGLSWYSKDISAKIENYLDLDLKAVMNNNYCLF